MHSHTLSPFSLLNRHPNHHSNLGAVSARLVKAAPPTSLAVKPANAAFTTMPMTSPTARLDKLGVP